MTIYGYERATGEPITDGDVETMYGDMLDECYEPYVMGHMEFYASRIMEELDPIGYRVGMSDYWSDLVAEGDYVESYEETDAYEDEEVDAEDDDEDESD